MTTTCPHCGFISIDPSPCVCSFCGSLMAELGPDGTQYLGMLV